MKIRSIELLRGLAALSVAVAHSDSLIGGSADLPFSRWHSFAMPGTAGVEFFFVLSGFVMALAHGQDIGRGKIGRFLWKRFCRIYPLYWVVLAIPVYQFWGAPSITPTALWEWITLSPTRADNLLVVAWTLRQEVTFYLVLALCLIPRIGGVILAAWVAATTTVWFIVPGPALTGPAAQVYLQVFSLFNFEFFAGLAAGWLLPRLPQGRVVGWSMLLAGGSLLGWRMSRDGWGVEYGPIGARPIYGAAYAAIILSCAALERASAFRFGPAGARIAAWAGALSYPLYLIHLPILGVVAAWLGGSGTAARIGPDATFAVLLAAAIAGAAILSVVVDQPVQRLLRRVGVPRRPEVVVPG